jgi:hypothetical protein
MKNRVISRQERLELGLDGAAYPGAGTFVACKSAVQ